MEELKVHNHIVNPKYIVPKQFTAVHIEVLGNIQDKVVFTRRGKFQSPTFLIRDEVHVIILPAYIIQIWDQT